MFKSNKMQIRIKLSIRLIVFVGLIGLGILTAYNILLKNTIKADELADIYNKKNQKQQELQKLNKQIKDILNSKESVYKKIQDLNKTLEIVEKQEKKAKTRLNNLSQELDNIKTARKMIYKQGAEFLTYSPNMLSFVKILSKNWQNNSNVLDLFLTYLSTRYYFTAKLQKIDTKEQKLYGQFLVTKKNYDTLVQMQNDLTSYLKKLKAQYNSTMANLYVSYSKRASLVREITALSAKAKKIIEQKARQNNNSNTIGGNTGSGTIIVDNGNGDFTLKYGNTTKNVNGTLYFSVQGQNCNNASIPQCPNSYLKVKIYNNTKSKNGGTWYYRGQLVLYPSLRDAFFINKVDLEEYVLGIGEMPNNWGAHGGEEALKAQAIAARTYAYAKYLKGLTLYDTTLDQNYVGAKKELASYGSYWVNAGASTKGQILKSGGKVITAYYHSSCGGATLSTQEVWGGYRPYALGIYDRYQENGKWVPYDKDSRYSAFARGNADVPMIYLEDILNASVYLKNHATGTYIPPAVQDKIACQLPIFSSVNKPASFHNIALKQHCSGSSLSAEALANTLGNNAINKQFDTITKVYATFVDNNGNVAGNQFNIGQKAKYTDSIVVQGKKNGVNKTIYIPAGFFKLAYNLRSPGSNYIGQSSKRGALFDIWQKPGDYSARTYGLGHRVGMCQYGAYGRAKKGQSYVQILTAYYSNLDLASGNIPVIYNNLGPTIKVKITQPGRALCSSSYSCDPSIKNGTYITSVSVSSGSLIIKNDDGQIVATINAGTWVDIYKH